MKINSKHKRTSQSVRRFGANNHQATMYRTRPTPSGFGVLAVAAMAMALRRVR